MQKFSRYIYAFKYIPRNKKNVVTIITIQSYTHIDFIIIYYILDRF